jgi:hypothetical protein
MLGRIERGSWQTVGVAEGYVAPGKNLLIEIN